MHSLLVLPNCVLVFGPVPRQTRCDKVGDQDKETPSHIQEFITPAGIELYGVPRVLKFISLQQRPRIRGRSLLCVCAKILITFVDQFKISLVTTMSLVCEGLPA